MWVWARAVQGYRAVALTCAVCFVSETQMPFAEKFSPVLHAALIIAFTKLGTLLMDY